MTVETLQTAEELLLPAISRKLLVEVTYNKGRSLLAPHSVLERHGESYLRAVTVERDGRAPRQPRLGTFKLSGLSDIAVTRRLFSKALFAKAEESAAPGR